MNEQLIGIAIEWSSKYPNFLEDFLGMVTEYRQLAIASGVSLDSLPATKTCLTAITEIFEALEGQ